MPKRKIKGKNRRRGKEEADGGKIKEDGLEIKSPPLSTDPRRASQMSAKSPSTDPEKQSVLGKVCIICYGRPELDMPIGGFADDDEMDFSLFLLDLDASSDVPVNPNMCFCSYKLLVEGFCVVGPNLYLFGNEGRDVFSYPLSLIPSVPSSPPEELTEGKLSKTPPMNFLKYFPRGCQTPDGTKMVVFSTMFDAAEERNGNFELFDGGKWTELPDLHPLICSSHPDMYSVRVISYSFIDNEPVLLITTQVGNFTLNIEHPERGWSRWKDFELPGVGYGLTMLVKGPWRLMDWFEWVDGTDPNLSYPWAIDGYNMCGGRITWLSPLNRFCVLRSHVETTTMRPHLTVDVCDFDDDDEISGPKLKKRIKFVVDLRMEESFLPLLLHSMR